jgi:hypothetical protein
VEGMAGAKLYQDNLPANSSEIIMDRDENIFYQVYTSLIKLNHIITFNWKI